MAGLPLVLPLNEPRCCDVALSGGKGASLAVMMGEGLPVPPGFVVTSAAFAGAVDVKAVRALMAGRDAAAVRSVVAAAKLPVDPIVQQYRRQKGSVAVRSSACAEDSERASYAGVQETYLNVDNLESLLKHIVECWLSFFSERAIFYREEKGSLDDVGIAVVIQEMFQSRKSGVLFTVDPVQGRRDRMIVEAGLGLGEVVVSGSTTPDHYVLDRQGGIRRRRASGTHDPVLSELECRTLAQLAQRVVELYGSEQDIEWAIDAAGAIALLQSRPVTTV